MPPPGFTKQNSGTAVCSGLLPCSYREGGALHAVFIVHGISGHNPAAHQLEADQHNVCSPLAAVSLMDCL